MEWLLAVISRVVLICAWIWTPLVERAFHGTWLLPLLGILILPIATLAYVLVYYYSGGNVTGWAWLWVVLGMLLDFGAHSYPARRAVRARSMPANPESM